MKTKLLQIEIRIAELEKLADEILKLGEDLSNGKIHQPEFLTKTQRWYRGSRAILEENNFSGIDEFNYCYISEDDRHRRSFTDIEKYSMIGANSHKNANLWNSPNQGKEYFGLFSEYFQKARSLLLSSVEEILSRELPIKTQLSLSIVSDEIDTAKNILKENSSDEVGLRLSGFITRIALERHLLTVANSRSIIIELNPPKKKTHNTNDILTSLAKHNIINPIQKSELESLFTIGNNCAHPKEDVTLSDVTRLVERTQELCSIII
jgi:hypothetical protein